MIAAASEQHMYAAASAALKVARQRLGIGA